MVTQWVTEYVREAEELEAVVAFAVELTSFVTGHGDCSNKVVEERLMRLTCEGEIWGVVNRARVVLHYKIVLSVAGDVWDSPGSNRTQRQFVSGWSNRTNREIEYSVPFCSTDGHTAVPQSGSRPVLVLLSAVPVHIVNDGETTLSEDVLCNE